MSRAIPQSEDAEKGILGSVLLAPGRILDECASMKVGAEWFFHPALRTTYGAVLQMAEEARPIDLISLTQYLEDKHLLEEVGGAVAISELFRFVPTASNSRYYLEILREKHLARLAIEVCEQVIAAAYDPRADIAQIAQEALVHIAGINESNAETKHIKDIILRRLDYYEELRANRGKVEGLSTGIKPLDSAIRNLRPGNMVVIAAETKGGKSALALNIGLNVAFNGNPVGIFSLEMNEGEIADRMIAARGAVDISCVSAEGMTAGDMQRFQRAALQIADQKVFIRDESVLKPSQFRAAARKLVAQQGCKLLIVDYLQLMQPSDPGETRERQVAEASRTVKTTASELGIPIIVLSQLNENGRSRESRAVEQDANIFAIIEHDDAGSWINIKYARDCRGGRIPVTFRKEHTAFSERIV